jgi:tetratricopeptide (TPR) repeat protein
MTSQSLYDNFLFCRDEMSTRFSLSELATLCQDVGIAADRLPHQTRDELAVGLLLWADSHNLRAKLIDHLSHARSSASWPDDYTTKVDTHTPIDRWPPPGTLPDPGLLPPGSRLIFGRNPLFTGREAELLDLSGLLRPDRSAPSPVVIATGIGGVGKTQLVTEFAYRYGRFFAGGVQWVTLDGDDATIQSEIVDCGAAMGLYDASDTTLTPEQKAARVREAWRGPTPRLIIFDNCEDPARLDRYAPPPGGGARVLVTNRNDDWPTGFARMSVPTLPRDESRALLRKYLERADPPRRESNTDLDAVAEELGDLPLALILAGSYLATYPSISVAGYLAELRRPGLLVHVSLRNKAGEVSWTKHDMDVGRTFAVSYAQLQPNDRKTDAAAVLMLAGAIYLVHGVPFPRELLTGMFKDNIDPHLPDDALRRLLALGLLERGEGQLRLHRLIAQFVVEELLHQQRRGEYTQAEDAATPVMFAAHRRVQWAVIGLAYKQNVVGDPRAMRIWHVHLRHVTDDALEREDSIAAILSSNLGSYLQMTGDLAEARPYFEYDLAICERVHGPKHPATATSLNNLGGLLDSIGDRSGALPYYQRALAIREKIFGLEHPETAQSFNNLGYLLQAMGDLTGARPYLESALAVRQKILSPEHPETAQSLNNLGYLLQAMGDLTGARPYLESALAIRERVLGLEHPDTAGSLNNLGYLLQEIGDLTGAQSYYERSLAIHECVLGPEHPVTAQSLNNLGALLCTQGDLAGARPYYERALAINERVLGPEHPNTATSLNNLGGLLRAQDDLAGARSYYERALAINERILGPKHANTATSLNNLGGLLQDMGNLIGARPYYERALAIFEDVLGLENPGTATSLNNLGGLLQDMGDLAGARPYFERTLAISERVLGLEHPGLVNLLSNLAILSMQEGNYFAAERHLVRAERIAHKALGPRHPHTVAMSTMLTQVQQLKRLPPGVRPRFMLGRVTEGGVFVDQPSAPTKKPRKKKRR